MSPGAGLLNPFPGLRPFGADEAHLFFGREEHVDELLEKLRSNRFVAVVGSSGSGKSSLVLAGLFPALDGGALGAQWRIASLRPGRHPIANLARALRHPAVSGSPVPEDPDPGDIALELGFAEAALRRSHLGLIEAVRELALQPGESLLLLVDQFEEIFRYQTAPAGPESSEADAFVPLLLEAVRQSEVPIHVILTLRSDFLGQCVRFPGLPEAINSGQYLIPRLNRRQRLAAIAGPARVAGAEISPPLLQRLLNDVGDNPDQLPILQHALMRTFDLWQARARPEVPRGPIEVTDYEAAGTLARALSNHAEEVFAELTDRQREIAEALFRSLTETTPEGQHIRRPASLGEIAEIAGASVEEVLDAVEPFRAPGRTFLVLPQGVPVTAETRVDISHESLMRLWDRLREWCD
ncbi:MAG TPA: AAA family ATPase, partial [Thermoanaerobaculia bacterium]|nr:AAA family ATPase [Thermoanaerobaculia bacterium]